MSSKHGWDSQEMRWTFYNLKINLFIGEPVLFNKSLYIFIPVWQTKLYWITSGNHVWLKCTHPYWTKLNFMHLKVLKSNDQSRKWYQSNKGGLSVKRQIKSKRKCVSMVQQQRNKVPFIPFVVIWKSAPLSRITLLSSFSLPPLFFFFFFSFISFPFFLLFLLLLLIYNFLLRIIYNTIACITIDLKVE